MSCDNRWRFAEIHLPDRWIPPPGSGTPFAAGEPDEIGAGQFGTTCRGRGRPGAR